MTAMCVESPIYTLGQQPRRDQKWIVKCILGAYHLTQLLVQTVASSTTRFLVGNFSCYPMA